MGLYLCVFRDDEEVDGVDVGSYDDYGNFLDTIIEELENGYAGARFPLLTLHSDCDGTWSVEECKSVRVALSEIGDAFKKLPPTTFKSQWQTDVAKLVGLRCANLYDCFIDVDGEPLIERLIGLCRCAEEMGCPILFQ